MEKIIKQLSAAALLALFGLVGGANLTGCNTTEGIGEDMQGVGEAIDGAAEDSNPDK